MVFSDYGYIRVCHLTKIRLGVPIKDFTGFGIHTYDTKYGMSGNVQWIWQG